MGGAISSLPSGIGIISSAGNPILPSQNVSNPQVSNKTPTYVWVEISTDSNGSNDLVYLTTLCQCLLLGLGEDPQYANLGIPAVQSAQTGIAPDTYVSRIQQYFSPYFASLTILRATNANGDPVYNVSVMTHQGVVINAAVPY